MSITLGEKLRQAREERGFTLSDVAEQTRISPLYLESIENDDYRILPGGIFNKGFVKSYAKFVGISESEALEDYSKLVSKTESAVDDEQLKVFRPEVLTDDRASSSMMPQIIVAVVMLGLMTAGILFLVNYLRQPPDETSVANNVKPSPNTNSETPVETTPTPADAPSMATVKVEFRAMSEAVSLAATTDGKSSSNMVAAGASQIFEPKESLKLSYSRSLANVVSMTINGKSIALPSQPLIPRRNTIEFEINKDNLAQIWTSGSVSGEVPAASPVPAANSEVPANTIPSATPAAATPPPASTPVRTPSPKPAAPVNTAANAAPRSTPERPASTPAAQPRSPANSLP